MLGRRKLLAGAALAPLAACAPAEPPAYTGGWSGADIERGHRLRGRKAAGLPAPEFTRRVGAIVVGAGVSGLATARELSRAGMDDVHLLDLEDEPGGNSRGHRIAGMACPLGAHYLPLPGDRAIEVIALLESLGVRRTERGAAVYDERMLCHSPQERLHIDGYWHDGLLPPVEALPAGERARTLAQYRRFGVSVVEAGAGGAFAMPTARSTWSARLDALDAVTFDAWLDAQALTAPALRWYLDYCCRDDYGAGSAQVSAWAGLHYFASRHGFHTGGDAADESAGMLTWPEGNAWLTRRMAEPLRERMHPGCTVMRVSESRDEVAVDLWNTPAQRAERWRAAHVVLAVPLFIAARLLDAPVPALTRVASLMPHAPWLVANLHLAESLAERPGAPLSWDNVVYEPGRRGANDIPALGYVDAMHQSTRSSPGPTVLTAYWALGGNTAAQLASQRERLLAEPWSGWAAAVVGEVSRAHADLRGKLRQVDLMRYGHAMSVPTPGLRSSAALRALAQAQPRVQFAHADLSGYSVFEEALFHGTRAARAVLQRQGRTVPG